MFVKSPVTSPLDMWISCLIGGVDQCISQVSVVLLAEPQLCVSRESVEMWLTVGPYVLWVNGPLLLRWQISDTWPTLWSVTLVQTLNVSAIIGFSLLGMKDMASDISRGRGAVKFR